MPKRVKIYTWTGDDGTTGLIGGRRTRKDAARIAAYGTVDELNSAIGLARALHPGRKLDAVLARVQNDLFNLGAELATPTAGLSRPTASVTAAHVAALEKLMDELEDDVPLLRNFILPGGAPAAAALHLARTICRRAERCCVALARREKVGPQVVPYLNRLGDALFVLARWINHRQDAKEIVWQKSP